VAAGIAEIPFEYDKGTPKIFKLFKKKRNNFKLTLTS
jgi:hypothetical protein